MPTLANFQGGSLVSNIESVLGDIGDVGKRLRTQSAVRQTLGDQQKPGGPLGFLGQFAPDLAPQVTQNQTERNPIVTGQLREKADENIRLAKEIRSLPTHSEKLRRIREEAARVSAQGGDIKEFEKLSNLTEDELDLKMKKTGLVGDAVRNATPAATGREALDFLSTPQGQAAFARLSAESPQLASSLLTARENEARRIATAQERQTARAAAAAGADRFAPVFDAAGNITGQENLATGRVVADPRAGGKTSSMQEKINLMVGNGIPQDVATNIATGVFRVSRDPIEQTAEVIDLSTGELVSSVPDSSIPADVGEPLPAADQARRDLRGSAVAAGSERDQALVNRERFDQSQGQPFISAEQFDTARFDQSPASFGIQGAGADIANTLADAAGLPVPFPGIQQTQAEFATLGQQLRSDLAAGFRRQPPAFLMEKIDALIPKAGEAFQGSSEAQAKLDALDGSLRTELTKTQKLLEGIRGITPATKSELAEQESGLQSAIARVAQAKASFDGGGGGSPRNPVLPRTQEEIDNLPTGTFYKIGNDVYIKAAR